MKTQRKRFVAASAPGRRTFGPRSVGELEIDGGVCKKRHFFAPPPVWSLLALEVAQAIVEDSVAGQGPVTWDAVSTVQRPGGAMDCGLPVLLDRGLESVRSLDL